LQAELAKDAGYIPKELATKQLGLIGENWRAVFYGRGGWKILAVGSRT
jgi:hypothetical protein